MNSVNSIFVDSTLAKKLKIFAGSKAVISLHRHDEIVHFVSSLMILDTSGVTMRMQNKIPIKASVDMSIPIEMLLQVPDVLEQWKGAGSSC